MSIETSLDIFKYKYGQKRSFSKAKIKITTKCHPRITWYINISNKHYLGFMSSISIRIFSFMKLRKTNKIIFSLEPIFNIITKKDKGRSKYVSIYLHQINL